MHAINDLLGLKGSCPSSEVAAARAKAVYDAVLGFDSVTVHTFNDQRDVTQHMRKALRMVYELLIHGTREFETANNTVPTAMPYSIFEFVKNSNDCATDFQVPSFSGQSGQLYGMTWFDANVLSNTEYVTPTVAYMHINALLRHTRCLM